MLQIFLLCIKIRGLVLQVSISRQCDNETESDSISHLGHAVHIAFSEIKIDLTQFYIELSTGIIIYTSRIFVKGKLKLIIIIIKCSIFTDNHR